MSQAISVISILLTDIGTIVGISGALLGAVSAAVARRDISPDSGLLDAMSCAAVAELIGRACDVAGDRVHLPLAHLLQTEAQEVSVFGTRADSSWRRPWPAWRLADTSVAGPQVTPMLERSVITHFAIEWTQSASMLMPMSPNAFARCGSTQSSSTVRHSLGMVHLHCGATEGMPNVEGRPD